MSSRRATLWIALFLLLALVGGGIDLLRGEGTTPDRGLRLASTGQVVRVIDGDTVRVRIGEATRTVRYIGVDTPESVKPGEPVQCFGKRAAAFNRRRVAGRRVRLQFGRERYDRYGRLLAYVYPVGTERRSVNAEIIARGYGRVLAIAPNTAHVRPYLRLERRAKQHGLGLWASCPVGGSALG
jgi:micrococcal nuclease